MNVIDEKAHQMALMKAASEGQLQCIEILIDAGADVNATAHGSNTALKKLPPMITKTVSGF